jgi:hypothetical protein
MFGFTPFAQAPFAALGVGYDIALSENVTVDNAQTITAQFLASFTDNITSDNAQTILAQFAASQTENVNIADVIAGGISTSVSITEPTTLDSVQSILAQFNLSITEAWGQTPYSVSQNPLTFAGFAMAGSPFAGNFNTNGFLENPSYVVQVNLLSSITENSNLANTQLITAQYLSSIVENSTLEDVPTILAQFSASIAENFDPADIATTTHQFVASIAENTTAADVVQLVAIYALAITENVNPASVQTILAQFQTSVTEAVTLADSSAQQSAFLQTITEAISLLDSQFPRGWFTIDDSQNANWGYRQQTFTDIANFGGTPFASLSFAGYAVVSGNVPDPIIPDANANWTQINNSQTEGWVEINNFQG